MCWEEQAAGERLEKILLQEAIKYSLDGINIDFENVKSKNGN